MNTTLEQQYLLFRVGDILACFNLAETLSVINPPKMISLPSIRGSIIRAFHHQDELGAVVSMRKKFAQPEQTDFSKGRLIMGRINGRLVGFWVDELLGITRLSDNIHIEDEELQQVTKDGAIDKVIVHREQRYLHINMLPFMSFEDPEQLSEWIRKKQLEWQERDRQYHAEEEEKVREAQRQERIEAREKQQLQLEREIASMRIDPEITLEYAQGLMEVAEYNEQQRLEAEAEAQRIAELEQQRLREEELARQKAEAEAAIKLPELGDIDSAAAEPETGADALFDEESAAQQSEQKKTVRWGAALKTGSFTLRKFQNLKALRLGGLIERLKRWGNRLVILGVVVCVVLIFKTIQPALYQQIIDAIAGVLGSMEIEQTWDKLWHKISSGTQSGS